MSDGMSLEEYEQQLAARGAYYANKASSENRIEDAEYYSDYQKRHAAKARKAQTEDRRNKRGS